MNVGITQAALNRATQTLKQRLTRLLVFFKREVFRIMLFRKSPVHRNGFGFRKTTFRLFGSVGKLRLRTIVKHLPRHANARQEHGFQKLGEVFAANKVVARNGMDLHDAREKLQNRNVERAAAQVKHQAPLVNRLTLRGLNRNGSHARSHRFFSRTRRRAAHAMRNCRRRGFVDNAAHLESCQFAGTFRGFTLQIVEICGHADNGLVHFAAQIHFGVFLQGAQHETGQFLGTKLHTIKLERAIGAHAALENACHAQGVQHAESARRFAHQNHAIFVDSHHRRREQLAQPIGNYLSTPIAETRDQAVCCSKINANQHAKTPTTKILFHSLPRQRSDKRPRA